MIVENLMSDNKSYRKREKQNEKKNNDLRCYNLRVGSAN